jgi:potassium-dependent mechanosensitive channel
MAARIVVGTAAVGSVAAAGLGYADLALFVARGLTASLVIIGGLLLLRGAIHEAISSAMHTDAALSWIGVSHDTAETLAFWVRLLLEPVFIAIAVILVGPFWGLTQQEMLTRAGTLLSGFKVGDVTISFTAIGLGLLVFIVILAIIRAIQRAMLANLLPRTRLDIGAQHSLTTGFGYLGAVIAIMVAISTLGIDLSNLAIVAGALSVGIGFGLQSIVNNFVSGLILLVERPVKVGDWVVVGDRQGFVKRIAVRATEVETFDRSSVIIPNSDLISSAVINRTHKDRIGRIDVAIGVAYSVDTRKVSEMLVEIATAHDEVISMPEPFVLFMGFGASSLDFELRCYTDHNIRSLRIATDLRHTIHERFAESGIEIPFP